MPIYEITQSAIRKLGETTFSAAGVRERADLQRLLRSNIEVISPDTLVIAEEFGEWEDSRRRIDLLGLDRDANLVVIELKRTEDGGHMELQAVRYAAMVSTLTFERVVDIFDAYLKRIGRAADARATVLEFLGWDDPDEEVFAQDVRIVLASAEFSKELTTAVMWLNDHGLDIRCIRMQPYDDQGRLLVDVQQVIPLPEAAAYQVQVREKEQRGRQERAERYGIRKRFWQGLLSRATAKTPLHANISPGEYHWVGASSGMRGLNFNYVIRQDVSGRANPATSGRVKTSHFEETQMSPVGFRATPLPQEPHHGESAQDGDHREHSYTAPAWLVPAPHRGRTGDQPRDRRTASAAA